MDVFKKIAEEMTYIVEASGQRIPENFADFLTKIMRRDPYIARLLLPPNTVYEEMPCSKDFNTAGVRPIDTQRINFLYCKDFMNKELNDTASINFLLKHEILHIILGHYERGAAVTKGLVWKHRLYNIAADVVINEKCKKEGGFGGLPCTVIKGGFLKDKEPGYNSLEEMFKEKYNGDMQAEAIFGWMLERYEKIKEEEEKNRPENEAAQIGDIIKLPDGSYGKVLAKNGKKITSIDPMTKAEVKKYFYGS